MIQVYSSPSYRRFFIIMNLSQKRRDRSKILSFYMLDEIGIEEAVFVKRKVDIIRTSMLNTNPYIKQILIGSRAEGLSFKTSDIDWIVEDRDITVIDPVQTDSKDGFGGTTLVLRREGCYPGFVMLEPLSNLDIFIANALFEHKDMSLVSSTRYRDGLISPEHGEVGHGPCITHTNRSLETDKAYCFRCEKWPIDAQEFVYRKRDHGWPSKQQVYESVKKGCHIIPKGDKDSELAHIQWKFSFALAEIYLMHSLSHSHLKVYVLLKMFLQEVINKDQDLRNLLCSYFLKTTLLYAVESTGISFWTDETLFDCFLLCLNKLIGYVDEGYCPNYFIRQNNMFRGKVYGTKKRKLHKKLLECQKLGFKCLYLFAKDQMESVRKVPIKLRPFCIQSLHAFREKNQEWLVDQFALLGVSNFNLIPSPNLHSAKLIFKRCLTLFVYSRSQQEEDICFIGLLRTLRLIGWINGDLGMRNTSSSECRKNKDVYCHIKKSYTLPNSICPL